MVKKVWTLDEVGTTKNVDGVKIDLTVAEREQFLIKWNANEDEKEIRKTAEEKKVTDKASANAKLQALGLTDDEITAITKG